MKIGIGVHGRFHGFELAKALLCLGHDVRIYTNYPGFIVKRFGLPPEIVTTYYWNGLISKISQKIGRVGNACFMNRYLCNNFEVWLAKRLAREQWDITYTWSSISECFLRGSRTSKARLIARGSSHISTQNRLLEEEEIRCGIPQEKPFAHTVTKELTEYDLADGVVVLSSFCKSTFLENGYDPRKLGLMVSGSPSDNFRLNEKDLGAKIRSLTEGLPLNILTVGTFSFRKGIFDYEKIVNELAGERYRFRFVGAVAEECAKIRKRLASKVEFVPRVAQSDLKEHYRWGHVFLFPTIEDGFPTVMAQARAACLPQITTTNGAGLDVVEEGKSGWIFPIRKPDLMIAKLREIQSNRPFLAQMIQNMHQKNISRTWIDSAKDFLAIAETVLSEPNRTMV